MVDYYPENIVLCEPHLSKRGLYPTLSGKKGKKFRKNYTDFLQYADGTNSLEKISNLIKLDISLVKKKYLKLKKFRIIK